MFRRLMAFLTKDEVISEEAKKRGDVVYGSQSIKAQIGLFGREPGDWDLQSRHPSISAKRVEHRLDQASGGDFYYTSPSSYHEGTFKVKEIGLDNKRGTNDDLQIADYTKRRVGLREQRLLNGLRVMDLQQTLADKERAVSNPEFGYRRDKDLEDISRIKFFRKNIRR